MTSRLTLFVVLLGISTLQASDKISVRGLLSYFPMDDNSQDISSTVGGSSSSNNALWTGSANYQTGIFGKAATVGNGAGSNYLVSTSSEFLFGTGSFTILYWVHVTANVSSDPVLIAGGGKNWSQSGITRGWVSSINNDDVKANVSDGSTRADSNKIDLDPGANRWALVALVVNRDTETLTNYVLDFNVTNIGDDASSPSSVSISSIGDLTGTNQNIVIGQDGNLAGYSLPATGIDDLSIWNRPLSQEEIQTIYTAGRNGTPLKDILVNVDLEVTLNQTTDKAALSWLAYDTSNLNNPQIKISRNGAVIATVSANETSYTDTPPIPNTSTTYLYRVELFDGSSPVADSAAEDSVTWLISQISDGLIANYRFEDGLNDTASYPPPHLGTSINGARIVGNGIYGHCLELKAQLHQGVFVSNHSDLNFATQNFTVSLWFKRWGAMNSALPNGETSDGALICKENWNSGINPGWGIYASSDGGLVWNIGDGSSRVKETIISGANAIANGFWHHILISCNRTNTARCFVDGVFVKAITISNIGNVNNTLPLSIGIDGNKKFPWQGHIDEVAIWNRSLNDPEAVSVFKDSKKGLALSGKSIVDSDHDGMADSWELDHFGNLDQVADEDFDSDGISNFKEYAMGSNPANGPQTASVKITRESYNGQVYPILHYKRPVIEGDVSYLPEASSDLTTWISGEGKFIPYGNPTHVGNGQKEYHFRYYQPVDSVAAGRILFRIRMESRYQAAIAEEITPSLEFVNGRAVITWKTSSPTVTIIQYNTGDPSSAVRFEDYNPTKEHKVVIDVPPGKTFTYTVIQEDANGVETRSNTFSLSSLWDYSPPAVPDQFGFDSSSNGINWSAKADEILALPGVLDRGYCLDLLCGDAHLAYELVRKSDLVIIAIENTQAKVDAARTFLMERGVYGTRVSVMLASDLSNLPFSKDFFNLIVSQSQIQNLTSYDNFKNSVLAYTIPGRGVIAGMKNNNMVADAPKSTNPGTGSWTMAYGNPANTSSSTEEFNGKKQMSEFELRWLGAPGPELAWDRQTAEQPPLAVNGRFYCQGKGRLLALDSHNGAVLWTKELDDAQRFNLLRDAGNLSADNEAVWLAYRKECWKMDGDTGKVTTYPLVAGPREDLDYVWNYVCSIGGQLLGSASINSAFYKNHWGSQFWYTDKAGNVAHEVVSDNLFALDKSTKLKKWEYQNGLLLSVTITVGNGKIFFLETRNTNAINGNSRRLSASIWKNNLYLVCLDLNTGNKLWEKNANFTGGENVVFLMYDATNDKLILSSSDGSKNYLYVFNPNNGAAVWNTSTAFFKNDHGGKNQHPVIVDGKIFLTPHSFNSNTGNILQSNIPKNSGQGCNTYWGSKNLLFFRTGYSGQGLSMWPTDNSASKSGIDEIKGACWLNWAPADGLFLIQEKSSGCSCGAWVHISTGWGPKQ